MPHDAQKTLCTNAYCLREHIKWDNLTHIPTIDKHAQGAWNGYNWRPNNNNKGGFTKRNYDGQGTQKNNKGPRDQQNNGGHQNPYPIRGHDSNNNNNTPTNENHRDYDNYQPRETNWEHGNPGYTPPEQRRYTEKYPQLQRGQYQKPTRRNNVPPHSTRNPPIIPSPINKMAPTNQPHKTLRETINITL